MSLTTLSVVSSSGETLNFHIGASTGYQLEEVRGLDPVKADISSSSFGQHDGSQYQSSRRGERNIVMVIGLVPDFVTNTVQSLRLDLARLLMPKRPVTLRMIDSDGSVVSIAGMVESFEAPLFTRTPKADISIICFDPDFKSHVLTTKTGSSVTDITNTAVQYDGSVDTGFLFEMTVNRATNELALVLVNSMGESQRVDFAMALSAGDKIEIGSNFGEKGVWVTKDGLRTPALYTITPNSNFLVLSPGVNQFRVQMAGAAIPWSIKYYERYGSL